MFIPDGESPTEALVVLAAHWEDRARQAPTKAMSTEYRRRAHECRQAANGKAQARLVPGGLMVPLFLEERH